MTAATIEKKNVVFIITDQQRYDSLGCHGNPGAKTPHLDALAKEGVDFKRFFTTCSICMPSRASLITGTYPSTHGVYTNGCVTPRSEGMSRAGFTKYMYDNGLGDPLSNLETIADAFKSAGYHTCSVGKLHFTPTQTPKEMGYPEANDRWDHDESMKDWHGPYYGFDEVHLSLGHGEMTDGHYRAWRETHFPDSTAAIREAEKHADHEACGAHLGGLTSEQHHSTWCGNEALGYLERAADKEEPFFLWVGLPDPHHPFTPPCDLKNSFSDSELLEPKTTWKNMEDKPEIVQASIRGKGSMKKEAIEKIRRYTDMMNHLIDVQVGRIVEQLKSTGQWENTLLVFTSDHGDFLGEFEVAQKVNLSYAALNHVPLIAHLPGVNGMNGSGPYLHRVGSIDLMPSLLDWAGARNVIPTTVQGECLSDHRDGKRRHEVMAQNWMQFPEVNLSYSILDDRYRLAWHTQSDGLELYDHEEDPYEAVNLAQEPAHQDRVQCMLTQLKDQTLKANRSMSGRIAVW